MGWLLSCTPFPLYNVTGNADISRYRSLPIIAHHFKTKALGEGKHYRGREFTRLGVYPIAHPVGGDIFQSWSGELPFTSLGCSPIVRNRLDREGPHRNFTQWLLCSRLWYTICRGSESTTGELKLGGPCALGPNTTQTASDISHHFAGSAFWPRATRSPVNNGNEICLLLSSPPRKQITHNNIIFPYTHLTWKSTKVSVIPGQSVALNKTQ